MTNNYESEVRRSFGLRLVTACAGLVSAFLLTVVVYRSLPPRESSVFYAILAALSIGPMLGMLGLGPNAIRMIPKAKSRDEKRQVASRHLVATFFLSSVSAPFVALIATGPLRGHYGYVAVLLLTIALVITESLRLMMSDVFAATARVGMAVATTHYVRNTVVLPVIALMAFTIHPSLVTVVAVYTTVSFVQLVSATIAGRQEFTFRVRMRLDELRTPIWHGLKLFVVDFSVFLCLPGTIWLANFVFSPHVAARYSAAATLALQVTVLESLAALAVTPAVARMWVEGTRKKAIQLLSAVATLSTIFTFVIVALLLVLGDFIMERAYGSSMANAGTLLVILASGGIAKTALRGNITLLIVSDNLNRAAWTSLICLSTIVVLAIGAAALGGPVELAVVSALGMTTIAVAQWAAARRTIGQVASPNLGVRSSLAAFR